MWMDSERSSNAGCHHSGLDARDLPDSPHILQDQKEHARQVREGSKWDKREKAPA